jgi:hypothetical protein
MTSSPPSTSNDASSALDHSTENQSDALLFWVPLSKAQCLMLAIQLERIRRVTQWSSQGEEY